jgi:hypothetical protein
LTKHIKKECWVQNVRLHNLLELKKKEVQFRKKDIMSKSPNYNAYYQLLALPTPRRMKVLEKLNTSRAEVSYSSRVLTDNN